ncbi:Transcriptional activator protein AnoR [Aliiroseovarius pelagivivens]|uniref:Transcriptional activator protein AnoR n=2 Tax=Aliiroseovarius pelagivivens TaxID=1639690 RepID=A0A2R8AG22_9RHOB|nr:Transcriptional activator protein AnoR [Aliiroseovarius pelagivivens]
MRPIDTHIIANISFEMQAAGSFDERWNTANTILNQLGADAITASAIKASTGEVKWFKSSLEQHVVDAYVEREMYRIDSLVSHAAQNGGPVVWGAERAFTNAKSQAEREFSGFVLDCGYKLIVSNSMPRSLNGIVRNLSYCSKMSISDFRRHGIRKAVQSAINQILPWIGWPEMDSQTPNLIPVRVKLTGREREALAYLSNGLMNARIAQSMGVSEAMVAKHLQSAKKKLKAKTREQAVAIAIMDRLIQL